MKFILSICWIHRNEVVWTRDRRYYDTFDEAVAAGGLITDHLRESPGIMGLRTWIQPGPCPRCDRREEGEPRCGACAVFHDTTVCEDLHSDSYSESEDEDEPTPITDVEAIKKDAKDKQDKPPPPRKASTPKKDAKDDKKVPPPRKDKPTEVTPPAPPPTSPRRRKRQQRAWERPQARRHQPEARWARPSR